MTKIYPSFKVADQEVTKRVLLKHLVCACTGLPRQDFEWLFTFARSSPQAQLDVLATMKPTTEFGALFQYSNPLASAAGYIAARTINQVRGRTRAGVRRRHAREGVPPAGDEPDDLLL